MEPITTAVVIVYIADKIVSQFIKEEGYGPLKKFFFPKKKYRQRLIENIMLTITEFEKTYPKPKNYGQFPFYESQILFELLNKQVLFNESQIELIQSQFKVNPNIIIPSEEELKLFYSLFKSRIDGDEELEDLFVSENYQNKIFEIGQSLVGIKQHLHSIDQKVAKILIDAEQTVRLDKNYVSKHIDQSLIDLLNGQDVLLLTGLSFCGKTETAKKVAESFVAKGFDFKTEKDIGEATRFLRGANQRIFVLEDPFGHDIHTESHSSLKPVNDLVQIIAPGNKLIITTRIEILKSIHQTDSLAQCSIKGHHWIDLTSNDKEFLVLAWQQFCSKMNVPEKTQQDIIEHIKQAKDTELLQVGQLETLSRLDAGDFDSKPIDELIRLARKDSLEISIDVERKGAVTTKLFALLGLSADTFRGVSIDDLKYLLGDNDETPSIHISDGWRSSGTERKEPVFPSYPTLDDLSEKYAHELGFFEARGFITLQNSLYYFSHPNYREAARNLLKTIRSDYWNNILHFLKRCFSCLNPDLVKTALINLEWLLINEPTTDRKKALITILHETAIYSIFPGIRDRVLTLLLAHLNFLDDDIIDRVYYRVQQDADDFYVGWKDRFPFIDEDSMDVLKYFVGRKPGNFIEAREKVAAANYSTKDLCNLIDSAPKENGSLSLEEAKKILGADEAFIRARFATNNLLFFHLFDNELLLALFNDDHPSVVFAAVRAGLLVFPKLTIEEQNKLEPLILSAFSKQYVIIRSSDLITTYGIDYGSESVDWGSVDEAHKQIMWEVWAKIICLFFDNFPSHLQLYNSGRFTVTIQTASKYLSAESGLKIAQSYFKWFQRYLHQKYLPSELSDVMYYLLTLTQSNPSVRLELFSSLLQVQSTSFILTSLGQCIANWHQLSEEEKNIVIEVIRANRPDRRWIRAVSIVRDFVPSEIQEQVWGNGKFLDYSAEEIYNSIDRDLLRDTLHVCFGIPYIFSNLSVNEPYSKRWTSILKIVLHNRDEIAYDMAVELMVYNLMNMSTENWNDGLSIWRTMCQNHNLDYLARVLIQATIDISFNIQYAQKLWSTLIEAYRQRGTIEELFALVIKNIEGIQYQARTDLPDVFGKTFIGEILERLDPDHEVLQLLHRLWSSKEKLPNENELVLTIVRKTRANHLRFEGVFVFMKKIIKANKVSTYNAKLLESIPNVIQKRGQKADKELREYTSKRDGEEPTDWIDFAGPST